MGYQLKAKTNIPQGQYYHFGDMQMVVLPAGEEPTDPHVVLGELKAYVSSLSIHTLVKNPYLFQVTKAQWYVEYDRTKQALATVKYIRYVTAWHARWGILSSEERQVIFDYLGSVEQLLQVK